MAVKKPLSKKSVAEKSSVKPTTVKVVKKDTKKWSRLKFLAIGNIVAFVAVLVINYLAVSLPIGGMTTGALSDLYPNLFTPAWLTFSIWWVIYLALLGFVIWQIVDLFKKKSSWITKKIWIWFLLSCAANVGWMFAWQYQRITLSIIIMLLFLVVLIIIANKVKLGKKLWTWTDKLFVQVPFSLYIWRISVATIANIAAWLVHLGWNMLWMTDIFWTIIVIVVAALLALIALYKKYNIIFALVVIRAFIGIIIKRLEVDPIYAKSIIRVLGICITIISAGIWRRFDKWTKN